jgi:ribonuclease H2 subunit C
VPKGYKGVVLVGSEKVLKEGSGDRNLEMEKSMDAEEEEDEDEEVKIMEEVAGFNGVWVWGHEAVMDGEDAYVRSLEEWIGVAESVSLNRPSYALVVELSN